MTEGEMSGLLHQKGDMYWWTVESLKEWLQNTDDGKYWNKQRPLNVLVKEYNQWAGAGGESSK